jgi:hypothetical protein
MPRLVRGLTEPARRGTREAIATFYQLLLDAGVEIVEVA